MYNLMTHLPVIYHDIKEMVVIMRTEGTEMDAVSAAIDQSLANQFINTASTQAIKRREQQFGIKSDSTTESTESLDFRRKRLIHRYSTRPPFTLRYLQIRLDGLLGTGVTKVELDIQNFRLTIKIKIPDAAYFLEVEHVIQLIKPANLVYYQETALADTLSLEDHMWTTPLHRMTKLGTSWRLGSTPFSIREQEVQVQ